MQNPGETEPIYTLNELVTMARLAAQNTDLEPELVCAVCEQESSWRPTAVRYEPAFRSRYVDPQGLSEPEATNRSTSWGLMQVMGEVAREFGYVEDLPTLLVPSNGLEVGCKVLAHKLAVNGGNISKGLLAWNGGANHAYADEVIARMPNYSSQNS